MACIFHSYCSDALQGIKWHLYWWVINSTSQNLWQGDIYQPQCLLSGMDTFNLLSFFVSQGWWMVVILPLQSELLTIAPPALEPLRSSPGERRGKVLVISCIFFRDANYCNLVFFQMLLEGRYSRFKKKKIFVLMILFFSGFFFLSIKCSDLKLKCSNPNGVPDLSATSLKWWNFQAG